MLEGVTAGYVEWFNNRRLPGAIGRKANYYAQTEPELLAGAAS
jgi:hypothetical protein